MSPGNQHQIHGDGPFAKVTIVDGVSKPSGNSVKPPDDHLTKIRR
jgi:hypothetical protein